MKVILIGYPGSQCIVKASKYLTNKYLPSTFDVIYLNYKGEIGGWSKYVVGFLEYLTDDKVIFALDDYLLADYIDIFKYSIAESKLKGDIVSVKLCQSTPEEHEEYPVTTQYTIWNRESLISILSRVKTPWEFEIDGSAYFKAAGLKTLHIPCMNYFANSSISSRWEGIRLDGLNNDDKLHVVSMFADEYKEGWDSIPTFYPQIGG